MKTVDFSEAIAASDLKVGRCRQLIESSGLAHMSQRLIGELICSIPMVQCLSSSTMLKHLLRNCLADQSLMLCGSSLGGGNKILFAACGSRDQDGKNVSNIFYRTGGPIFTKLGM